MRWLVLILFFQIQWLYGGVREITGTVRSDCAIAQDQSLWCWGDNRKGQLGRGNTTYAKNPVLVYEDPVIKPTQIAANKYSRFCALFSNGRIKCWGDNYSGLLGYEVSQSPIGAKSKETLKNLPYVNLGTDVRVKQIALGELHHCVLTTEGRVKCWGLNRYGLLGQGKPNIHQVIGNKSMQMGDHLDYVDFGQTTAETLCATTASTCVLLKNGQVKCWGRGTSLPNGSGQNIGLFPNQMGENLKPVNFGHHKKVKKLECAGQATYVLFDDGELAYFGRNMTQYIGMQNAYQFFLGDHPTETGLNLPRIHLGEGVQIQDLACGFQHCCALLDNHAIKCWGYNFFAQLGMGDLVHRPLPNTSMSYLPFAKLGKFKRVKKLFAYGVNTCVEYFDGELKCWGGVHIPKSNFLDAVGDVVSEMGDNLPSVKFIPPKRLLISHSSR